MVHVEICIDSVESAKAVAHIVNQGNNGVELCSNLIYGGGLTPSMGLLRSIKHHIPANRIRVMIRPRTGSFIYTKDELETMEADIQAMDREGVRGVVLGCLQKDGSIDTAATQRLIDAAHGCEVTFHRAFDTTPDWKKSWEDVKRLSGIGRILTSGHGRNVMEGIDELKQLVSSSEALDEGTITIAAGSGVNAKTIIPLLTQVPGLKEVHFTASNAVKPEMTEELRRGVELGFGLEEWKIDVDKVEAIWETVRAHRPST